MFLLFCHSSRCRLVLVTASLYLALLFNARFNSSTPAQANSELDLSQRVFALDQYPAPLANDSPTIVGGQEAAPEAWPWQAALVKANDENAADGQFCGGALIDPQWVMTAAHCVESRQPKELQVVLGRHQLSLNEGERISVTEILIHPAYIGWQTGADIALMHLMQRSKQQPIPLDATDSPLAETRALQAMVTGWGMTDEATKPDVLREAELPLVAHDVCNAPDANEGLVTSDMVCAGYAKGGKGACYGDSGGPLMIPSTEASGWIEVGIVSWGPIGCTGESKYGVYTRVANFANWVHSCLADSKASLCTGKDQYEPDNDAAHAQFIIPNSDGQNHNLRPTTDQDWSTFDAVRGITYVIETKNLRGNADTLLWLYGSDSKTALAYDDDSGTEPQASRIIWRALDNGRVFIQVQNYNTINSSDARYTLQVAGLAEHRYLPIVSR